MENKNIISEDFKFSLFLDNLKSYLSFDELVTLISFLKENRELSEDDLTHLFIEKHKDLAFKIIIIGGFSNEI